MEHYGGAIFSTGEARAPPIMLKQLKMPCPKTQTRHNWHLLRVSGIHGHRLLEAAFPVATLDDRGISCDQQYFSYSTKNRRSAKVSFVKLRSAKVSFMTFSPIEERRGSTEYQSCLMTVTRTMTAAWNGNKNAKRSLVRQRRNISLHCQSSFIYSTQRSRHQQLYVTCTCASSTNSQVYRKYTYTSM